MKPLVPIALSGLVLLLTSCSSSNSTAPTATTTTTTSTAEETKTETADASKDDSSRDDATKTDTSDEKPDADKSDSTDKADKADASSDATDAPGTARNLYVEQLKKPDAKINTGVVYWLELNRDGKKSHVTNKAQFQEGDQLRIHIKPNIACYSYVLELQGSNGEKSVLFPSDDLPDNKLKAGKEVILPVAKGGDEAWIKFDEHPGTEVMRIVVSRKKLDPSKELPGAESSTVSIASARSSDSDSIPDGATATIVAADDSTKGSKNLTVVTKGKSSDDEGTTTVVSKSGEKSLRVDLAMDHRGKKGE